MIVFIIDSIRQLTNNVDHHRPFIALEVDITQQLDNAFAHVETGILQQCSTNNQSLAIQSKPINA